MAAISRQLTTLSVSWLNNRFTAVAVHHGTVQGTWERPDLHDEPEQFEEYIREAVQATGYQGQTVSLVLAHPRLVQQMIDVPPAKWSAQQKIVQRQAHAQKFFSGEAAYAAQPLVSSKASPRLMLHLFPRLVLNQFMVACKRNNLHLVSVLPVSVVLQLQLAGLALQKSDVVMLAAETNGSTTLVVGDGDGRLLLARTLPGSWNTDAGRLAVDLNRTLLFVSQQFNLNINKGLHLFGDGAEEHAAELRSQIQLPIVVSTAASPPFHWAIDSLRVRPDTAPNFLSPELQKAPQRRVFAEVVAAGAALLMIGAVALTAYSVIQSRREQATLDSFGRQVSQIEERQKELQLLDAELERKQQAIRLVQGDRPPPKPAWLLAYLGQIVPADLVITNFNVRREADHYRVTLAGTHQQAVKSPTAPPLSNSLALLKSQLAGSPFHVRILEKTNAAPAGPDPKTAPRAESSRVPLADWLNRVTTAVAARANPAPAREEMDHFVIEGVLQ